MSYTEVTKEEQKLYSRALEQLEFPALTEFIAKYAQSDSGKEAVRQLKPVSNLDFLIDEHNTIAELTQVEIAEENLPFHGFGDVRQLLRKSVIANAVMTPEEFQKIRFFLRESRTLKHYFAPKSEKYPIVCSKISYIFENRLTERHIDDVISETAEVKDTASRELSRIRMSIADKTNRLRIRLEKLLAKAMKENTAAEEYVSLRDGRYVLPIKAEFKRNIPGVIHNVSQTGATVFLEPSETFELNNEISMLQSDENREIMRILQNLTAEVGTDSMAFMQNFEILTYFDSALARAKYALAYGGVKPTLSEENEVALTGIRHPLLCHAKGTKNIIPLTTFFSSEKRGQLISGPNAGGKTVALKSIGLNVAMALSGIFPLGECRTNFRVIFSSIGDNQSIENDLSTFSSQILQLKNIIDNCGPNSLILTDEICSGTDPQEGAALACGILDTFIELKSFFIVTTHQSSLKSYSLNHPEIENASLEFDEEHLKPTYKFLLGTPGNSYAFVLSKSLGMNKLVLKRARKYLGNTHSQLEKSISQLQKYKFEAEQYRQEMLKEKVKTEQLQKNLDARLKEIREKKSDIIKKANDDALDIITKANALVEKTILEIKEKERPLGEVKTDFERQRKAIKNKVGRAEAQLNKMKPKDDSELAVGDSVVMVDSDDDTTNIGELLALGDDGKTALVDFNGLKFNVAVKKIRKSGKRPSRAVVKSSGAFSMDAKTRLDLRGERAAEAIRKIDELIDDAILKNTPTLTIVHGKGTGALRKAIQEYLADNPAVKNFRSGELVEGGDGVTIIDL